MNKTKIVTTIIGLAISVLAIWYALRAIDLGELWAALKAVNWLWAIPCLFLAWVSFIIRAWRWQVLLSPYRRIGLWSLFGPMMIGFGFNGLLPARLGEFLRPLALVKTEKVPFTTGFSTVFVERVLDIVVLLSLAALAPLLINFDQAVAFEWREGQVLSPEALKDIIRGLSLAGLVLLAGSIMMLFKKTRDLFEAVVRRMPVLSDTLKDKVCAIFHSFAEGFSSLRSPKLVVIALFQSWLVWIVTAWSFSLMAYGIDGLDVSLKDALVFTLITCLAITLPAAPGYWGLYELGGKLALVLAGVVANDSSGWTLAVGFTLVVHFLHWSLTSVLGLWYAARIHIKPSEAVAVAEAQEDPPASLPPLAP